MTFDPLILLAIGVAVVGAVLVIRIVMTRSGRPPVVQGTGTPKPAIHDERGLKARLSKTRSALAESLSAVFSGDVLGDDLWEDLEDALIAADVAPGPAATVVKSVRRTSPASAEEARLALASEIEALLAQGSRSLDLQGSPAVIVVVGVNGTGKTTSIAKIANNLATDGHSVVLGAADTFRAAADVQLKEWGGRVGVPVVSGDQGSDPASVAFDAVAKAREAGADVVIIDTAGRLHSQQNLMDELGKVVRVLKREAGRISEVLLVLDGTTGQNGIAQARAFTDAVGVTGAVITKLDGTARGGIAVAVEHELGIPIKYIGLGEAMDDLVPFVPGDFVEALIAP